MSQEWTLAELVEFTTPSVRPGMRLVEASALRAVEDERDRFERDLRWIWRTCRRNLDGEKSASYLGILNFIEAYMPDVAGRMIEEERAPLAGIGNGDE